ncbi:hypothetical protein GC093_23350 [Paenibacillus sp. LMG 31456]|uniref:Uncharacterized protein n=1 Tax=Paenibacillus foliorum TaxID=2654974 RepID=A0A972GXS9_9BACL|nr:hypothetical protein [Paenibacillus foliorum]NOU96138.1 hypothetical protein [Paenibacillus foliorum]
MAQGVVDVIVSKDQNENSLVLVANCGGGLPNDLHLIRDGAEVTLKQGDIEKSVVVNHEAGAECAFNYIEMNAKTAKAFGLHDGSRVLLTYDSESKDLRLQRVTKSRASGLLLSDHNKTRTGSIIIGYSLLSLLGIPTTRGTTITIRVNSVSQRMKVLIPENELDSDFRLSPLNLRKFGLHPGKSFSLEYDQTSKTLSVLTSSAVASKQGKPTRALRPMRTIKTATTDKPTKSSRARNMENPKKLGNRATAQTLGNSMKTKTLRQSTASKMSKKSSSVKKPGTLAILAKGQHMGTSKTLTRNKKRMH